MTRRMKIVNIVGARPNLMKIAPLMAELRRHESAESVLVHTGQHYDDNMSRVFFEDLGLPQPDHYLGIGSGTHTEQTAGVMRALEPLFHELEPDVVVVVGDVNSTVAGALVAAKMGIPVAHVEAGLRSFDRTMPEELNRVVTDALSDYHFTTERGAGDNLRREGIAAETIHFVGNLMIDTLVRHREGAVSLGMPARYGLRPREYGVITMHRPSNVDVPSMLARMVDLLDWVQERLPIVFPAHPRTTNRLRGTGLLERVRAMPGLRLLEPLGYLEFLGLMADARLVLTDSGGIQEETTILGVPCLTVRENTERPVTLTDGTNRLVGTDPERIRAAVTETLEAERPGERRPELWDGRAAERIARVLLDEDAVAAAGASADARESVTAAKRAAARRRGDVSG